MTALRFLTLLSDPPAAAATAAVAPSSYGDRDRAKDEAPDPAVAVRLSATERIRCEELNESN